MRYFLISDVHGNLPALEAVFANMKLLPNAFDSARDLLINLGDTIGYGAFPNECMDAVWNITPRNLIGNHDEATNALARKEKPSFEFNSRALNAIRWTAERLNDRNKERLVALCANPANFSITEDDLIFTHSTPLTPDLMMYIRDRWDANNFFFKQPQFAGKTAFVGHLHMPQIYFNKKGSSYNLEGGHIQCHPANSPSTIRTPLDTTLFMKQDRQDSPITKVWDLKYNLQTLVSIPSVGQPRDNCWYTGYAIYDSDIKQLIFKRLPYDVKKAMNAMVPHIQSGIDPRLIERLAHGQ